MTIRPRRHAMTRATAILLTAGVSSAVAPCVRASDCNATSVGLVPINDLATGLYLGQYQGGLYPGGSNDVPPAHAAAGLSRANSIEPLDINGIPDPGGKYVLVSIGMSNTTQEYCSQSSDPPCDPWTFTGQAAVHADVHHSRLAIVNGARGGQTAAAWDQPTDANYDRIRDTRLIPLGLSEAQVQIAWVKVANAGPTVSLPNPTADANVMLAQMGNIARTLKTRYPNLKQAFFGSRIYAGYASTTLNPEPYAYEGGFAVKWLIEAQINQMTGGGQHPLAGNLNYDTVAPWIAWGPYLWGDGLNPRSDGLTWVCADMQSDGTHPAATGEEKVGAMLLQFMLESPFTAPWFRIASPTTNVPSQSLLAAIAAAGVMGLWACLAMRRASSIRHSTNYGSP